VHHCGERTTCSQSSLARSVRRITAEAIKASLLQDDAAAPVIARVAAHGGKSREWVAMNMAHGFTAHYTMGNLPWARDLEREQVKGKYVRYRKIETPTERKA
jgi:hypothetical protein